MVSEIEVKMFAEKSVKMPLFTGYVARGLALHIIQRVDPVLAQNLHEPNSVKPYSVTPLYFRSAKKFDDGYQLNVSSPCIFKMRFLDDSIAKSAINYFYSNENLMIYDTIFKVGSLTIRSDDFTKVEDSKLFRLYFDTPTHLAKIGSKFDRVFPEPLAIFPNLMRVWDSCICLKKFGKEAHTEYREWIEKNMTVSAYDMHTLTVNGKGMKIGFVGWCAYRITDNEDNKGYDLITNKLARFAEYSNVGMERTAGFGVVIYRNNIYNQNLGSHNEDRINR